MMAILQIILGIFYPVVIFFSLSHFEPRLVAFVVLGLAATRLFLARSSLAIAFVKEVWLPVVAVGAVALGTAIWNDPLGLLLAPSLINLALLTTFGLSLRGPRPMIERFARLQVEDLADAEVHYCRSVTWIWCGFFVINGSIVLYLALTRDLEAWALFTGLISYILIGTLFGLEYFYRHWRFRRFMGGPIDPLLKILFPPRAE